MPILNFYHDSYKECRKAFLCAAQEVKALHTIIESIPLNELQEDLFTDIVHLKSEGKNPLVVLTSGLHGIEGYVGSALQLFLMAKIFSREIDISGIDLLFVHAVNPWGFKNNRRVTRNNIDLNRNFSLTDDLFQIKNPGYSKIRSILEPGKKYSRRSLEHFTFPLKIIKSIQENSKSTLVQAIGEGQYEYKNGIIFGGKDFEKENINISKALRKYCDPYEKVVIIDLHTGLGKRGKLQLLNAPRIPDQVKQQVNKLFDNRLIDDSDDNFFKEHGSFLDFVWEMNKEKECLPVMFEFGTINSDNLFGALRTLKTMIIENQAYQLGSKTSQDKTYIDRIFLDMFYPRDINWRNEVIKQFYDTINKILPKLKT